MLLEIICLFSIILNCIMAYVIYNLYKKNAFMEKLLYYINNSMNELYLTMKQIDSRQIFQKDDDVGVTFDQLLNIIYNTNLHLGFLEDEQNEENKKKETR